MIKAPRIISAHCLFLESINGRKPAPLYVIIKDVFGVTESAIG